MNPIPESGKSQAGSCSTLSWTISRGIGNLTLNQPPANAMTMAFFQDMALIRKEILHHKELKAIIITGRGRHFSSGAVIDELLSGIGQQASVKDQLNPDAAMPFLLENYHSVSFLEDLPIPVISAIRGVCLGSALELALLSHFRFCGNDAVFGLPETTFNLIPGIGGIQRFSTLTGKAKALEYILTGKTFDAETALKLGIVDAIRPKKEVMDFSMAFARWLPGNYQKSLRKMYVKRSLNQLRIEN